MLKETIAGAQTLAAEKKTALLCPVMAQTLDLIRGKWKPLLLRRLAQGSPRRFGELHRQLDGLVTRHTLTQQLRELEQDGVVARRVYAEVPPRVEYALTSKGHSLYGLLSQVYNWGVAQGASAKEA